MPVTPDITLTLSTTIDCDELSFVLELDEPGRKPLCASGAFSSPLPTTLSSDLCWYMERFLDEQDEAAAVHSKQVRESIKRSGRRLFHEVFQSTEDGRAIWRRVAQRLSRTKIEINADYKTAGLPWELLRDPTTNAPLCLSAASFVHSVESTGQGIAEALPKLKLLLVISRPDGSKDVAFRTISSTILNSLRASPKLQAVVLRPPTYEELARVLRDAASDGEPYDLVHFDGHGFYHAGAANSSAGENAGGYIIFEGSAAGVGYAVSGAEFAALASECGVRAVVLNACRSAYQEPNDNADLSRTRPAASFAYSLLTAGVPAVVAMNFNVYVVSAKRFMEEFYRQLARGQTLSAAASLARKHLSTDKTRFHQDSSEIDDWLVPAIYCRTGFDLQVNTPTDGATEPCRLTLPQAFPPAPDLGFVGSDDALLQIDRSFDVHNIVLLYGLAGSGKSAASVEFSSWYRETASETQILLFTSFEASPTLGEVLAGVEPEIGIRLRGLELTEAAVQDSIILSLASKGALWVWDSVETVAGMNVTNREDFSKFITRANGSGLKLLLTARDQQENWVYDLASLVEMPSFRLSESIEFAKRILSRKGIRKFDGSIWMPLLEFAAGNPLTLRVSISSFLATRRRPSRQMIRDYVDSLRHGTGQLGEPMGDDRTRSLTASLNYGLQNAFDAHAVKVLSLLSLFRIYVNSFTIWIMCRPITDVSTSGIPDHDFSWSIPDLRDETHQSVEHILEKATALGLLRKSEDYNFWLHPAIHLHLRPFFDRSYPGTEQREIARRAYAEAEGMFSIQFTRYLQVGGRDRVIGALRKEEANLHQALYLSRINRWWQAELGLLHGISALLLHEGRHEEWRMVFSSVWDDFIGPDLKSLPGRERYWPFILDHRLRIAMEDGDLDRAEPIARLIKTYEEERAKGIVRQPGYPYSEAERKSLHDLAIATGRLADVLREKEEAECIAANEEALAIYQLIKDRPGIAIRHFNLGHCYKNIARIRDLKEAEQHYRIAYDNYPKNDGLTRAQCLAQISTVWVDRVQEQADGKPLNTELKEQFDAAVEQYEQALQMLPDNAWGDLANLHNKLAAALRFDPARQEEALDHVRKSCQCAIAVGRYYEAATARGNLAQMLAMMHRSEEAVAAARQAISEFEAMGVTNREFIGVLERIVRRGL